MIFNRLIGEKDVNVNDWKDIYTFEKGYDITPFQAQLKESTYFACIKLISESIAKCDLELRIKTEEGEVQAKDHYMYEKLKLRPNMYMSAIDCYKAFVALAKHNGYSGIFIDRKGSKIDGLYPVKITGVIIDSAGLIKSDKNNKIIWDFQAVEGEYGSCFDRDLIILRDFTLDGIKAKANRNILSKSLDSSIKSQEYLNNLFSNGLTNKLAVQLTSDLKEEGDLKKYKLNLIECTAVTVGYLQSQRVIMFNL